MTAEDAIAMLEPGDILVDCTGSKSVFAIALFPVPTKRTPTANTHTIRLEHALVITFLYGQSYECNEYCKYYKNAGNDQYKFIPSVHRTYTDGNITHVTGIVTITADEYEAMPATFDGAWLRDSFPGGRRIDGSLHRQDQGGIAWRAHRRARDHPHPAEPLPGSQRHQPAVAHDGTLLPSVRAARRCSFSAIRRSARRTSSRSHWASSARLFLARLIAVRDRSLKESLDRYEAFVYKQWLRVYMRSKMIKHNKDLLQCVDDTDALLDKLHLY